MVFSMNGLGVLGSDDFGKFFSNILGGSGQGCLSICASIFLRAIGSFLTQVQTWWFFCLSSQGQIQLKTSSLLH